MIILSPFHSVCLSYGLNVSSKTYVEGLALIVARFGHGASKEIIQIKWSHKGWESPDPIGLLYYEKRHQRVCSLSLNAIWECNEKLGICKPGRETSPETDPAAAAAKSLQSCPTLCDPIDGSPPGSPRPWDSPGKNTGVGCHFLLQCMKVRSESEVTQLYLNLGLLAFRTVRKLICCFSLPVYGILLWQP